jgi:hypothetical protein
MMDGMFEALTGARLPRNGSEWGSLAPLCTALIGRHRRQIARDLGTPPAVWDGLRAPRSHWEAMTWYYPCDEGSRRAIAIRFVNDRARKIEVIRGPG